MKKNKPAALSVFLLAAAVSASVQAQQQAAQAAEEDSGQATAEAVDLDRVMVTGMRTAKAVDKIPGAVTVVTPEEIRNTLALTEDLTSVLSRTVPGYSESTQQMGSRGENLRGRIALRLFDGIPQGSPLREGNRSATFTDMGVVGRIEVINGPSAAEGIGAAGGIINYISKTPEEGTHATLSTRYGSQFKGDSDSWKIGLNFGHKEDAYDLLVSTAFLDRGVSYDGKGNRVGRSTAGSLADSESKNLFLKFGMNFGEGDAQRLQATLSRFDVTGKGNYVNVPGQPEFGIPSTSVRGEPLGSKTEFNDFRQYTLTYTHSNFFDGTLFANLYTADQAMRYPTENSIDRQDPEIAPIGQLNDQSEIHSKKKGLRTGWTRGNFLVEGLELRAGVDVVEDEAEQSLALTHRVWVPPMQYSSTAPYLQLSYDIGPVTLSGGIRREDGELEVNDYTTTWYRNRVFVQGGKLEYQENLVNFGAIVRLPAGWSVYGSYGEGFTLPNVGIPLRNINTPGRSVDDIEGLQPIVVENKEIGANWAGERGSFGVSLYRSTSDFGASLQVDPATGDYVMVRAPTEIEGVELTGAWRFSDALRANAVYSHAEGKTAFYEDGPMVKEMGIIDVSPDKLSASLSWKILPQLELNLAATRWFSRNIHSVENEDYQFHEETDGYTLFDASVAYDMGRYGRLSLGVENIFDKYYILNTSQFGGSSPVLWENYYEPDYLAGRGRSFSLTHTINF
ncbi:TonB-dependent receptor [Vulcaniibacterium tengchongense]|uniref:Iron complex outermembrane receptor protein n=1 Tax=Vulcaniibacterium tengchongense TaxID=1273429 RepID=A0A3N4VJ19_9GAMM|nr:TonB-dependent receptor [Vulcaniibacterium tengchongense]RPE77037.1 iron complex outermembrane receptor protein [Vulcaniibacterium tengchongense]